MCCASETARKHYHMPTDWQHSALAVFATYYSIYWYVLRWFNHLHALCVFVVRATAGTIVAVARQGKREMSSKGGAANAFMDASRSTAASGSTVYEGERAVHEYLQFHFGRYSTLEDIITFVQQLCTIIIQ